MEKRLPSVLGCGVGFAAAGSCVGSFAGMFVGGRLWRSLPEAGRPASPIEVVYLWLFRGLLVGVLLGAWAGVAYARAARRSRRRPHPR